MTLSRRVQKQVAHFLREGRFERQREVMRVESLSDADLAAIAAVEPPEKNRYLDSELE